MAIYVAVYGECAEADIVGAGQVPLGGREPTISLLTFYALTRMLVTLRMLASVSACVLVTPFRARTNRKGECLPVVVRSRGVRSVF